MFRPALTLMTIRGIPIRLHISLLLVVPFLAITFATRDLPRLLRRLDIAPESLVLSPLGLGLALAVGIFVAVALHELGHALVARAQGGRVEAITLMVLGGVTEVDHEDATPAQEFWMAFAGPLVNLVLAGIAFPLSRLDGLVPDLSIGLRVMVVANLFLALFNLVPAFPLDGGRMLRAGLRAHLGVERATRIASAVGRLAGVGAVVYGLMQGQPMLAVVGAVVFLGASQERARVALPGRLLGLRARQAMIDRVARVYPTTSVEGVVRHLLMRGASAAVIAGPEGVLGVLLPEDLRRAAPQKTAAELLSGEALCTTPEAGLETVLMAIRTRRRPAVVMDAEGRIAGVVTLESVARIAALSQLSETLRVAARGRVRADRVD